MQRKWLIMIVVSLAFFFVTGTTFTSLGLVLYTMVAELHWSQSAAGFSFSLLGLACGLTSLLPAIAMKWMGTRLTMLLGSVVLALGFFLASISHGIWLFFAATCLMGAGFSLLAPVPAIYAIATWFPKNSSRIVGLYFMIGAAGGVLGPPLVNAIVQWSANWRVHWALMAASAFVLGLLCFAVVKDIVPIKTTADVEKAGAAPEPIAPDEPGWSVRDAVLTRPFILIALSMLIIQTGVTTIHGLFVTHMGHLGATNAMGAYAMGLIGLTDTLAKGASGTLAERIDPRRILLGGVVMQCAAFLMLGLLGSVNIAFAFTFIFGIGWGASWLSAHVLLLRYFGSHASAGVIASATMMTTAAVIGPAAAGMVADATGSFAPVFVALSVLFAVVVVLVSFIKAPGSPRSRSELDAAALSDAHDVLSIAK